MGADSWVGWVGVAVGTLKVPDDFGAGSGPSADLQHSLHCGFCPIGNLTRHRFGNSVLTPVPKIQGHRFHTNYHFEETINDECQYIKSDVKRWKRQSNSSTTLLYLQAWSPHALTWVGCGSRCLALRRCRSAPIWCAAAARWRRGNDTQTPFPAKDRLNSSTRTRRRETITPSPLIYPDISAKYRRFSSKSGKYAPLWRTDTESATEWGKRSLSKSQ